MRRIFVDCCARPTAPPNANVNAKAKIPTHFGFWIFDFGLREQEPETLFEENYFMRLALLIQNQKWDHLISLLARESTLPRLFSLGDFV